MSNIEHHHLKPPKQALNYQPEAHQITNSFKGRDRRHIYYNVEFSQKQHKMIREFRELIRSKKGMNQEEYDDQTLLRYIYSGDLKLDDALQKLLIYHQWMHNPAIQTQNPKSIEILKEGFIYTFGRDRRYRPVVILNMSLVDFSKYTHDQYYGAINILLKTVIGHMFVPGRIQKYTFITDMGGKNFTTLPLDGLVKIVSKLGIVYSGRLEHMIIVNLNYMLKLSWMALKPFIAEETRNRTFLLTTNEMKDLQEKIQPQQLESKLGGMRNNLTVHWPPRVPKSRNSINQEREKLEKLDESVYYSVMQDNEMFFLQGQQHVNQCCSIQENASCVIY